MNSRLDDYITALPAIRQLWARTLHRLVQRLFPGAQFSFHYKMPTYVVGDNFLAWGNKKSYFSVYTCSGVRIAAFKAKHPEFPSGVGCLNFRDRDEFPLHDLERVIKNALAPSSRLLQQERAVSKATRKSRKRRTA